MQESPMQCPCRSGLVVQNCCGESLSALQLEVTPDEVETYLLDWTEKFAPACSETFHRKARTFSYRISRYLDAIVDAYLPLGYPTPIELRGDTDELYRSQKHSVAMTIAGAFRLLADGLFLQSGVLLRTAVESSLVLLDIAMHPLAIDDVLNNKYRSQSVVKRVKQFIPSDVVSWYGYFSANFTHVAAVHQSSYMPRACYPDNWVIVTGLQNILRATVTYHIVLERAYVSGNDACWFWTKRETGFVFSEESAVFKWAQALGESIRKELPLDAPPAGMRRSNRSVTLKS